MTQRHIYPFTFGDMSQKDLLGGKGANLAEMVRIGYLFLQDLQLQQLPAANI